MNRKLIEMNTLINCIMVARELNKNYIGVKIEMSDMEECEVIINPTANFFAKLDYYKSAYNQDLTLKNAPDKIKIVDVSMGDSYSDIEKQLIKNK